VSRRAKRRKCRRQNRENCCPFKPLLTLTLPHELSGLALQNKQLMYGLLFRASAETLLEVAADPKHLGAQIGFVSVLHTWGQNLLHHPHVHCVIPAGGMTADHSAWVPARSGFFLPVRILSRVFRGKFVAGLKRAWRKGEIGFHGNLRYLSDSTRFHSFLRQLFRKDWVVYAKQPFGGPEHVLHYLAHYTHRVAISNHRLLSCADGQVTFRWKDYAHGNKKRKMTVSTEEFLRRFLLHVLPREFVRIRHFGFLTNRHRAQCVCRCRQLLDAIPHPQSATKPVRDVTWPCPQCAGPMVVVERLSVQQVRERRAGWESFVDTS